MSKYLLAALLCLSSITAFGTARPEVKAAFKANVQIHQQTITENAYCSATAIGPQALLTATHCELPTDDLEVSTLDQPVKIVGRIRDGYDHTIYLIDGGTFKDTAKVVQNGLELTDTVFIWGNPGEMNDMYRVGVFSGIHQDQGFFGPTGPQEAMFQLPIFPGDSGAGIFAENGTVVEVVSFTAQQQTKDGREISFAGAYALSFKDEDLDRAAKFTTPQKDSHGDKSNTATPNK